MHKNTARAAVVGLIDLQLLLPTVGGNYLASYTGTKGTKRDEMSPSSPDTGDVKDREVYRPRPFVPSSVPDALGPKEVTATCTEATPGGPAVNDASIGRKRALLGAPGLGHRIRKMAARWQYTDNDVAEALAAAAVDPTGWKMLVEDDEQHADRAVRAGHTWPPASFVSVHRPVGEHA